MDPSLWATVVNNPVLLWTKLFPVFINKNAPVPSVHLLSPTLKQVQNDNEDDKLFTDYFDDFNDYKYACVSALSSKICGNTIVLNEEQYKRMAVTDVIAYVPNAYEIELAS